MHTYICKYVHTFISSYICKYMYIYKYIWTWTFWYIFWFFCIYICIYILMSTYIYIHIFMCIGISDISCPLFPETSFRFSGTSSMCLLFVQHYVSGLMGLIVGTCWNHLWREILNHFEAEPFSKNATQFPFWWNFKNKPFLFILCRFLWFQQKLGMDGWLDKHHSQIATPSTDWCNICRLMQNG